MRMTGSAAVAAAVEQQRTHFNSFNLQLGYRYGYEEAAANVSDYVPRFEVGCSLPQIHLHTGDWLMARLPNDEFTLLICADGEAWPRLALCTLRDGVDFEPLAPLHEQAGLTPSGALLIRPDGHICARWHSLPHAPEQALRNALNEALHAGQ